MHINNKDILFNKVNFPLQNYRLEILNRVQFSWKLGLFGLAGNWGIRLLIFNGGIFIGRFGYIGSSSSVGKVHWVFKLSSVNICFVNAREDKDMLMILPYVHFDECY